MAHLPSCPARLHAGHDTPAWQYASPGHDNSHMETFHHQQRGGWGRLNREYILIYTVKTNTFRGPLVWQKLANWMDGWMDPRNTFYSCTICWWVCENNALTYKTSSYTKIKTDSDFKDLNPNLFDWNLCPQRFFHRELSALSVKRAVIKVGQERNKDEARWENGRKCKRGQHLHWSISMFTMHMDVGVFFLGGGGLKKLFKHSTYQPFCEILFVSWTYDLFHTSHLNLLNSYIQLYICQSSS